MPVHILLPTLLKLKFEVMAHSPYSQDLAPSDYHLFDPLKEALTLIVPRAWEIGYTQPFIKFQGKSTTHFVYFGKPFMNVRVQQLDTFRQ